jgi:hypothetical protein
MRATPIVLLDGDRGAASMGKQHDGIGASLTDVVQLFIDRAQLHIRTGFSLQHGAKVFEDLQLDKAPEAAPK